MNQTIRIENEETLKRFISDADGLHDALLHEAVLLHPGFVDASGKMFGDFKLPDARMIFQSQFADIAAIQLDLKRVSRFRLEPKGEFRLEGEIASGEVSLFLLGKDKAGLSEIRAAEIEYRLLGNEFWGAEYHLIGVPTA